MQSRLQTHDRSGRGTTRCHRSLCWWARRRCQRAVGGSADWEWVAVLGELQAAAGVEGRQTVQEVLETLSGTIAGKFLVGLAEGGATSGGDRAPVKTKLVWR